LASSKSKSSRSYSGWAWLIRSAAILSTWSPYSGSGKEECLEGHEYESSDSQDDIDKLACSWVAKYRDREGKGVG